MPLETQAKVLRVLYLTTMLKRRGGNISQTTEAIGMARQSLQQKLKELGIRADEHKA